MTSDKIVSAVNALKTIGLGPYTKDRCIVTTRRGVAIRVMETNFAIGQTADLLTAKLADIGSENAGSIRQELKARCVLNAIDDIV